MDRGPSLRKSFREWWSRESPKGRFHAAVAAARLAGDFLRESLPEGRRRRYGDIDFDWEHRVDTTAATLDWRTRLLGLLHSPYQAIEAEPLRNMIASLAVDYREFTFIDIGSGKGRALLVASEYPFRRVVGVELLPELKRVSEENILRYSARRCPSIEVISADAVEFRFPSEPLVVFLFNPLPEPGLRRLVRNLGCSLRKNPRPAYVIYANALLEDVVDDCAELHLREKTPSYTVWAAGSG